MTVSPMLAALPIVVPPAVRTAIRGWRVFLFPDLFAEVLRAVIRDDRALVGWLVRLSRSEARCAAALRRLASEPLWADEAATMLTQADARDACRLTYAGLADRLADAKSLPSPDHPRNSHDIPTIDASAPERMLVAYLVDLHMLLVTDLKIAALAKTIDIERRQLADRLEGMRLIQITQAQHHGACVARMIDAGVLDTQAIARWAARYDRFWWDGVAWAGTLLGAASKHRHTAMFV